MESLKNFRANLRYALNALGISQRALAKKAKSSHVHVNRIFQGHVDPSITVCHNLAEAAGLDLELLLKHPVDFIREFDEKFSAAVA